MALSIIHFQVKRTIAIPYFSSVQYRPTHLLRRHMMESLRRQVVRVLVDRESDSITSVSASGHQQSLLPSIINTLVNISDHGWLLTWPHTLFSVANAITTSFDVCTRKTVRIYHGLRVTHSYYILIFSIHTHTHMGVWQYKLSHPTTQRDSLLTHQHHCIHPYIMNIQPQRPSPGTMLGSTSSLRLDLK